MFVTCSSLARYPSGPAGLISNSSLMDWANLVVLFLLFHVVSSLKSTDLLQRWTLSIPKVGLDEALKLRGQIQFPDQHFGEFHLPNLESLQDAGTMPTAAPGAASLPYSNARSNGIGHPDPIGMSAGVLVLFYAAYSVYRYRREANRIISLFEANTQIKELSESAARGEPLPNIVVIRGHISADGGDICTVSTGIDGLRERVGEIEQPKNAWRPGLQDLKFSFMNMVLLNMVQHGVIFVVFA